MPWTIRQRRPAVTAGGASASVSAPLCQVLRGLEEWVSRTMVLRCGLLARFLPRPLARAMTQLLPATGLVHPTPWPEWLAISATAQTPRYGVRRAWRASRISRTNGKVQHRRVATRPYASQTTLPRHQNVSARRMTSQGWPRRCGIWRGYTI